jgi:iron complex outermembrane receptor protein
VNTDLKPERGTLYEIGTKGAWLDRRLVYELALFDLYVKDKFTPVTVTGTGGSTYTVTTNGGAQHNRGVEVATNYAVVKQPNGIVSLVQPYIAYTYSNFRYDNFKSNSNNDSTTIDYSNKKVVGVPTNTFNAGLTLATRWGVYLNADYQFVDSVPLTYDNNHTAKSFSLLGAKLGYQREFDNHFRIDAFVGGRNLLASLYYTMVFLNANYTGPEPNVYLPGPYSATFFGGVNLSYAL